MKGGIEIRGFEPIVGKSPKVLILGSMPSVASLQRGEYYGNPRNAFWKIMADVCGFERGKSYEERCRLVTECGIAIWDVLKCCERPGSADSAIERDSEVVNDIYEFVDKFPIERILFNGGKAEEIFKRKNIREVMERNNKKIRYDKMPSTSPAYASLSYEGKLKKWRKGLQILNKN